MLLHKLFPSSPCQGKKGCALSTTGRGPRQGSAWLIIALVLLLIILQSACTSAATPADGLKVMEVWGRALPASVANGGFYMHIINDSDTDEGMLSVASEFCPKTEIHRTTIDDAGVMHMEMVTGGTLPIPAHEEVMMEPGGLHVMCMGKTEAFEIGDEIPLVLTFAQAGEMTVTAVIRDEPMGEMEHE